MFFNTHNKAMLMADAGGGGNPTPNDTITMTAQELQSKIDSAVSKAVETSKNKMQVDINLLNSKVEELSPYKTKYEEYENSKLTEQQKIEKMQKEAKDMLSKAKVISNTAIVKSLFSEAELKGNEIDELVASIVTDDEKVSRESAEKHISLLKKVAEEIAKTQYNSALSNMPNPKKDNGSSATVTREQLEKMSFSEKLKLKTEQPELWKQFTSTKN